MSDEAPPVRAFTWSVRRALRMPATWVLCLLLAVGSWRIGVTVRQAVEAYPFATMIAAVLFGLYAVPFLIFITNVDYLEPEPAALMAVAFGWGGLVATATAIPANAALESLLAKATSPEFAARWGPALVAPTIEEPVKALGVVMIAVIARRQLNSVLDGFVYGAVVGLGFQVVEDIVYAANAVAADADGDRIDPVLNTFFARGFVSGLWSHTVFTALAGAGIAYAVVLYHSKPVARRLAVTVLGVGGAWLCHFTWNSPLLTDGLGALAELLVKGVPTLILVLALAKTAAYREADFYVDRLQRLADDRAATPEELAALRSHSGRIAAQRAAQEAVRRRTRRWLAARAMRRLQRAQARLAVELSRNGDDRRCAPVERAYREVVSARERLVEIIEAGAGPGRLWR